MESPQQHTQTSPQCEAGRQNAAVSEEQIAYTLTFIHDMLMCPDCVQRVALVASCTAGWTIGNYHVYVDMWDDRKWCLMEFLGGVFKLGYIKLRICGCHMQTRRAHKRGAAVWNLVSLASYMTKDWRMGRCFSQAVLSMKRSGLHKPACRVCWSFATSRHNVAVATWHRGCREKTAAVLFVVVNMQMWLEQQYVNVHVLISVRFHGSVAKSDDQLPTFFWPCS